VDERISKLLGPIAEPSGASDEALGRLLQYVGVPLPADYLEFLRWSNGAEGFLGSDDEEGPYLALCRAEEIPELTESGKAMHPGCLHIGSSGDSTFCLLIDVSGSTPETAQFLQFDPYGDGDGIECRTGSFGELLEHLADWAP
jgi:hypothetical protein